MNKILLIFLPLLALSAFAEALLPPVGSAWKFARNEAAQAKYEITTQQGRPSLHLSIFSEGGYAFYRANPALKPGQYTLSVHASGSSAKGFAFEIYSFNAKKVPKLLLYSFSPAGCIQGQTFHHSFQVPADSSFLRVGLGLTGKGEVFFHSPAILPGKIPAPKPSLSSLPHPVTQKWLAEWIWLQNDPGLPRVSFQKDFDLADNPVSAMVQLTADNGYVLSVNDKLVGSDVDWKNVEIYDIGSFLRRGPNRIKVEVLNYDGPGGMLLQGMILTEKNQIVPLKSDAGWHISAAGQNTPLRLQSLGKVPCVPWGQIPFHQIAPASPLQLSVLEAVRQVRAGEVLKFVFPLTKELQDCSKDRLFLHFFNEAGQPVPLTGLRPVIRIEKKPVNRLYLEVPTSQFACPGSYRSEIHYKNYVIPGGEVTLTSQAGISSRPNIRIPGPSLNNRMAAADSSQSMFLYATNTPSPENDFLWTKTGGHLYEISLSSGEWKSTGNYNLFNCEQRMLQILEQDPQAGLILKFRVDVPGWWVAAHPDEVFYSNRKRSALQSYCSENWRKDAVRAIASAMSELSARPVGRALSGLLLMGFRGGEFQLWGEDVGEYDCSPAARKAFLDYQKKNGRTAIITLPHPALEFPFVSRSPEDDEIRDFFFRFTAERHAENIIYLTSELKKRVRPEYAVGVYFGYGMEHSSNVKRMLFGGHLGIEKVLREAPLDLISCPISYGLRKRDKSHAFMNPADSARLHGILPIGENDVRNYRIPERGDSSGETILSLRDSIINNLRIRIFGAAHGVLVRYLSLHPVCDAFADMPMVRSIAADNRTIMDFKANPVGATGQIALVSGQLTWTKAWRLPQKKITEFASSSRDLVMRTGRDAVFITFEDYASICRRFSYAVIPLPGLLEPAQIAHLEKQLGRLPQLKPDDGALIFNNGRWEIVSDNSREIWEKLATAEARKKGFGTIWYTGANFRYSWDGEKLLRQ